MQAGVEWKGAQACGASGEEGTCRVSSEELHGKCCGSREFAGGGSTVPGSVGSRECHSPPACEPTPLQLMESEITLGC